MWSGESVWLGVRCRRRDSLGKEGGSKQIYIYCVASLLREWYVFLSNWPDQPYFMYVSFLRVFRMQAILASLVGRLQPFAAHSHLHKSHPVFADHRHSSSKGPRGGGAAISIAWLWGQPPSGRHSCLPFSPHQGLCAPAAFTQPPTPAKCADSRTTFFIFRWVVYLGWCRCCGISISIYILRDESESERWSESESIWVGVGDEVYLYLFIF